MRTQVRLGLIGSLIPTRIVLDSAFVDAAERSKRDEDRLPHELSSSETAHALFDLYRAAGNSSLEAFAELAQAWMKRFIHFDSGSVITSYGDRPSYTDAHFYGIEDPQALLDSFRSVSHLDELSPLVLAEPFVVHRRDWNDPRIQGERFAPLRAHLARFSLIHSLFVAVPAEDATSATVFIVTRGTGGDRFRREDMAWLEQNAPHLAEAWAICRRITLLGHPAKGPSEEALAIVDARGRIAHATNSFSQRLWRGDAPHSPHLSEECLEALAAGRPWPVLGGTDVLRGTGDETGGYLVRLRPLGKLDRLTERERQVAARFANGASHTDIAASLGIAAATARNHLRHIYDKLAISNRVELITVLRGETGQ